MKSWCNSNSNWFDNQPDKYCQDCHFNSTESTEEPCLKCQEQDKWKNRYKPLNDI